MFGPLEILSLTSFCLYLALGLIGSDFRFDGDGQDASFSAFLRVLSLEEVAPFTLDRDDEFDRESIDSREALLNKSGALESAPFIFGVLR